MKPDYINGLFELMGAGFAWANVVKLYKDKEIKGVCWGTWLFWVTWGMWNLIYYPSLDQWASFWGGIFLVLGNFAWLILVLFYSRKNKGEYIVVNGKKIFVSIEKYGS